MKRGERYLSGEIDLGALGKVQLRVFRNRNKQKEDHPHYRICIVDEEEHKEILEWEIKLAEKTLEPLGDQYGR